MKFSLLRNSVAVCRLVLDLKSLFSIVEYFESFEKGISLNVFAFYNLLEKQVLTYQHKVYDVSLSYLLLEFQNWMCRVSSI